MHPDIENDEALSSYIQTALWSTTAAEQMEMEYLDEVYDITDFDDDTLQAMSKELHEFIDKYYDLVQPADKNVEISYFAHNFWLTRNGHGAGFWDGDYKNGNKLTKAAEEYGQLELEVGDDGKIYSLQ